MKPLCKVNIEWSPNFSYAIGLIASDGNLSKDGRHIILTSKDEEMILNFKKCLKLNNKIGRNARGGSKIKKYFKVQFGDVNFYRFLLGIGITPAKSRTMGPIKIGNKYYPDFLRGLLDGDGSINIFWHPESKLPQLRIRFFSASQRFINWIVDRTNSILDTRGFQRLKKGEIELTYAKSDSLKILNFIYYKNFTYCLKRKYLKAKPFLYC